MRLSLFVLYLSCLIFGNINPAQAGVMTVRDNTVYNHKPSHNDQTRIFLHTDFRISPQTTIDNYAAPEVIAEEREDEDCTNHLYKNVKQSSYNFQSFYLPFTFNTAEHSQTFSSPNLATTVDRYLLIRVLRI
jgi:hypothetical protein